MLNLLKRIQKDESGAALAEYGILVTGVIIGTLAGVQIYGTALKTFFSTLATTLGL